MALMMATVEETMVIREYLASELLELRQTFRSRRDVSVIKEDFLSK